MSNINEIIMPQGFEQVRDAIGQILYTEIDHQFYLTSDIDLRTENPDSPMKVWVERFAAFDYTDLPTIEVSLAKGIYENKTQRSADGTYSYYIDIHTFGKLKLHKMLRICRYILDNAIYNTLGFDRPFISGTEIKEFDIAQNKQFDTRHTAMGRLHFKVRVTEHQKLIDGLLIDQSFAKIKLQQSDKGYYYGF